MAMPTATRIGSQPSAHQPHRCQTDGHEEQRKQAEEADQSGNSTKLITSGRAPLKSNPLLFGRPHWDEKHSLFPTRSGLRADSTSYAAIPAAASRPGTARTLPAGAPPSG